MRRQMAVSIKNVWSEMKSASTCVNLKEYNRVLHSISSPKLQAAQWCYRKSKRNSLYSSV